jgi:hypothetical protein
MEDDQGHDGNEYEEDTGLMPIVMAFLFIPLVVLFLIIAIGLLEVFLAGLIGMFI